MISFLKIQNLALVESIELEFEKGFSVVTGETGAGKSVILGALSLLSGNRADRSCIRQGAEKAEVEAVLFFQNPQKIDRCLENLELPKCEDGNLLLYRSVSSKKARIQINGKLATRSALETLGKTWIDFHGPGEPQKLLEEKYQRIFLDTFAQLEADLETYKSIFLEKKHFEQQRTDLQNAQKLSPDEIDFLNAQLEKFEKIDLTQQGIDNLESKAKYIQSQQTILEKSIFLENNFCGDQGILEKLTFLRKEAESLGSIDPKLDFIERIDALILECEDLASEYSKMQSLSFDEEEVAVIQEQFDVWLSLQRHYGQGLESVLAKKSSIEHKLFSQTDIEGQIEKLTEKIDILEKTLLEKADILFEKRKASAKSLGQSVSQKLLSLGFKKAAFEIKILQVDGLFEYGNSFPKYLFSPNPGQALMPLENIASSGEMARVMLALKTLLAKFDETPVLVFDEVDANIGGEIATTVGSELASIAQEHQVLCITHLPQVAAKAKNHFCVDKVQTETDTSIEITLLDKKSDRIDEFARMIGDRSSASAISHATELAQTIH